MARLVSEASRLYESAGLRAVRIYENTNTGYPTTVRNWRYLLCRTQTVAGKVKDSASQKRVSYHVVFVEES